MEDTLRKLFHYLARQQKHKRTRHLHIDETSAGADHVSRSVSRPHISLKARMLGGRAETIMRLGGSMR
jgi:hypothetical protein